MDDNPEIIRFIWIHGSSKNSIAIYTHDLNNFRGYILNYDDEAKVELRKMCPFDGSIVEFEQPGRNFPNFTTHHLDVISYVIANNKDIAAKLKHK